ncbi:MAG: hypothetical protein KGJ23_09745 [Euryarchaeota archaeon]|nr:hypothetical protein [Euryarchaeota archaeon]MDE1836885.1 hypothetical protein [Euryarchaeota archaeon]MDE1881353.1 hypothetical protein [Euryarchaeota archaeon]MDE2045288.1 hypothetical protein [Thermoplasmata archaeon]
MPSSRASPVTWVRLLQALVARELVEGLGLPAQRAAALLGLTPAAVSQYLSGKRLRSEFLSHATDEGARGVARRVASELSERRLEGEERLRVFLEGALSLSASFTGARGPKDPAGAAAPGVGDARTREMARWLRQRVRGEQAAVTLSMRLAQRARDELTRAILRQIASDSLRHAEIVASLAPYLDQGVVQAHASGITRREVQALIEGERRAEAQAATELTHHLGGTMALLLASMEADERKHAALLQGLLATGFGAPPSEPVRRKSLPRRHR